MKIIDAKGRLLGKVNVIDFLAIIFLLSLTPMFYYGYKIFYKNPAATAMQGVQTQKEEFIETKLSFVFKKISPQVLSFISAGDKEINKDKEIVGEILSLGEASPYNYEVAIGSAKKAIADPLLKDLAVTLRIKAQLRQNSLYYKDKQISDNSTIDFVTDKYKVEALYAPALVENNNRTEDVSDSIKIIKRKQKEMEYEVSKLQNKISLLENSITSAGASSVTKEREAVKNK